MLDKNLEQFKNIEPEVILNIFNDILKYEEIKSSTNFLEFIGISSYGLDALTDGNKTKEGYISKKSKKRRYGCLLNMLTCYMIKCCNFSQKRWFILQEDMICYLESSTSNIGKDVIKKYLILKLLLLLNIYLLKKNKIIGFLV